MYKSPSVSRKSTHGDVSRFLRLHQHDWLRVSIIMCITVLMVAILSTHILTALTRRIPRRTILIANESRHG